MPVHINSLGFRDGREYAIQKRPGTFRILVLGDHADHGWRRILLVSSPYHMRRAVLTWRKVAPDVEVIPTPVPESQFYSHQWGASLEQIRGILHEYAALADYWRRGWV